MYWTLNTVYIAAASVLLSYMDAVKILAAFFLIARESNRQKSELSRQNTNKHIANIDHFGWEAGS